MNKRGSMHVSPSTRVSRSSRTTHWPKWPRGAFIALLLIVGYSGLEPRLLTLREYKFAETDRAAGLSIVFLSDIHHGPFFSRSRVRALVDRVNRLEPDIVILGGDYVHRDPEYIEPVFAELRRLKARYLVAGVLGNHDHWEGRALSLSAMAKAGIVDIDDSSVEILAGGRRVRFHGVDDFFAGRPSVDPASLEGEDAFDVLVSHNPDFVETLDPALLAKFDLVLSGHTHGGQVTFFGLWAPILPSRYGQKYRSGERRLPGGARMIVSNGIGTITPPLRFFAPPQICLIRI